MRSLLAELVKRIAEQHQSEKEVIIQTEALNFFVAAILMRLDDTMRVQMKNVINEAFASENSSDSSCTSEKRMLQLAVEELFTFQKGPHQER
ncbi:TPA: hypothetical protein L9L20_004877 [Klebsiella pneumoniae]|nr:hypothetical protein [Klebsiella pneumoniae]